MMNRQIRAIHKHIINELAPKFETHTASTLSYLILEALYGLSRTKIIAFGDDTIESTPGKENEIIANLLNDLPIEYILGKREFYGREFTVNENTLIPRPETEELVRLIIAENKTSNPKIIDLGSGSGAICVSLSLEIEGSEVYGLDVSTKALEVAKTNSNKLGAGVKFIECDLLKCEKLETGFDIIVSNPPYVTNSEKKEMKDNVLNYEPHLALFVEDNDPLIFYNKIATLALDALKEGGKLYFEINEYFKLEMIDLLTTKGYKDVRIINDLFEKPRIAVAKR
ncbi:MAG: peptide chain release factor N(5)-glutamine methyltransferase [Rikenellaceae bacterium]